MSVPIRICDESFITDSGKSTYRLNGLQEKDEHPTNAYVHGNLYQGWARDVNGRD